MMCKPLFFVISTTKQKHFKKNNDQDNKDMGSSVINGTDGADDGIM